MLPAPSTNPGATARLTLVTCPAAEHTASAYARSRCRCPVGREARRVYLKRHREGRAAPARVDATGARRRVQGLMVMGWTGDAIAAAAGLSSQQAVSEVATAPGRISRTTDAAVRCATAKLGGIPGPSVHAKRRALKRGYIPLWAWDDDIDDPTARPHGVRRRQPMPKLTAADLARFEQYRQPAGACARWTGCVDEAGRGKFALHGVGRNTTVRARRVAYWLHTGRDAAGEVRTSCGNSWCCAGPHMVDGAQMRKAAA